MGTEPGGLKGGVRSEACKSLLGIVVTKSANRDGDFWGYQDKIPSNVVERELVPTGVLNPNASESSYKPKQRGHRKTKVKKPVIVRA